MKNNKFKINVGDLLQSAGNTDHFDFKNETIDELKSLGSDGINANVMLQSFDKNSLLVTLTNISTNINEQCDSCSKDYTRNVKIKEYSAKFQKQTDKNEVTDDEVFKIDGNENIDIKDMLTQAIILQEPFVKRCPTCTKKLSEESDDFDNDNNYLEGTGNITFR